MIHIDDFEKRKNIKGRYYSELFGRFDDKLNEKRTRFTKKKVLFHNDYAPAHTSAFAMAKLGKLRYELVPHLPYSTGLVRCDIFLFPNLKNSLAGNRFGSNEEVIAAILQPSRNRI